ncbi:hypothetical protein [Paraflavitalea pollutisoli]|uniref:hypothetical protein n=1 Tax=Paraflavitalea pollutisoli TaxID=3034143 RepID=UPI0023EC5A35|nr:hypothetical protein [Paraflavitalea sp. H1-2-19X]
MKKILLPAIVCVAASCQSKKESTFQLQLLELEQGYTNYRATQTEYDKYKPRHDSILWQARRVACNKKFDTVTMKVVDIIDFGGDGSYEIKCESKSFVYVARIRFKENMDTKASPFSAFRRSIDKGDVITSPMYLYEVSGMGLEKPGFEIYFWPIPDGVTDIKAQFKKDLYNTWGGAVADQFESNDCNRFKQPTP